MFTIKPSKNKLENIFTKAWVEESASSLDMFGATGCGYFLAIEKHQKDGAWHYY
jgi:hypothetical protein